jgi:oligopeptide/dipeptide ABC transporter ATP-binding protein
MSGQGAPAPLGDGDLALRLEGVTASFTSGPVSLIAVNDVSLDIRKKEIVGIVGESGCGKSMTIRTVLGIVPPPGKVVAGRILFEGQDLLAFGENQLRTVRGNRISLVYQDPLSSLNPSFTIYWHFNEILRAHRPRMARSARVAAIIEALRTVRIPNPEQKMWQYPHQFSGGMRQRVAIAMAMLLRPSIIVADEPTTALDVTTQKEIFNLIEKMREELSMSFLVISHDLRLISERCDRIYVMYSGQVIESGSSQEIFDQPLNPYTRGLLDSSPSLDPDIKELKTIDGEVQNLADLPKGCFFAPRCSEAEDRCRSEEQVLRRISSTRSVRCWKATP